MKIKSFLAKPFASYVYTRIRKGMATAVQDQENILKELLKVVKTTEFGKDHGLEGVNTYEEFKKSGSHPRLRSPQALYRKDQGGEA